MNKNNLLVVLFFFLISIIFQISANGIYNSMDSTQYFTGEAIIKNQNLDLKPFKDDPHFFIYPDVFFHEDQILNVRGYMTSVLTIPFHFLSNYIDDYIKLSNFEKSVYEKTNFKYELSISTFFTTFTIIGLVFIYLFLDKHKRNILLNLLIVSLFGFGTYVWKYASAYTRHGISFLLIVMALYGFYNWYYRGNNKSLLLLFLSIAFSFGIDLPLFLSLCFSLIFLFYPNKKLPDIKKLITIALLPCVLLVSTIFLNLHFYNSPISSQTTQQYTIKEIVGEENVGKVWTSSNLIPSMRSLLFNIGPLKSDVFTNLDSLPQEVSIFLSAPYARVIHFYGLFVISPFLVFGFISLLNRNNLKKYRSLLLFSGSIFLIGISLNSKVLNFWGGNQYDIRYIYPYAVLLVFPLKLFLDNLFIYRKFHHEVFLKIIFFAVSAFSIFMSWMGVLNMYKPALTGERKIWSDFTTISDIFYNNNFSNFINATFPNRENILLFGFINLVVILIVYSIYTLYLKIKERFKYSGLSL